MEVRDKSIAFFDSGVGGLTVFAKMKEVLPNENYIYFGDLKNSPYGEKSKAELIQISKKVFDFFAQKDVKAVVMACNTTSANVYEELKNDYNFEIYPIIQTSAKALSNTERVCVFATSATVKSKAWTKYIQQNNPNATVLEIACPEWVKIVEENKIEDETSLEEIKKYMTKALDFNPQKIVLGCTHYPYLLNVLSKFALPEIFLNPAEEFVNYIKTDLTLKSLLNGGVNSSEEFFVSADAESFTHAGGMFYYFKNLPQKIELK